MLENNKNLIANPVNFMDINEVDVCKIAKEELKKLSCESVVDAYNDYADQTGEEKFYTNDDDFFSCLDPFDAVKLTYYGEYNPFDDLVQVNTLGNFDSYSYFQSYEVCIDDDDFLEYYYNNVISVDKSKKH